VAPAPLTLGILASHRGSNARAVIEACRDGALDARVGLLISNNARSGALAYAREAGVPARWIGGSATPDETARDGAILAALREHGVDLVLLLGYMRLLGPRTVAAYRGRILNTHPALLPKFGGRGMYGDRVHRAVLAAGEKETGVTVHLVDEVYDHGTPLARCTVPVLTGDTVEALAERVVVRERRFVVETLQRIVTGELTLPESTGAGGTSP
jgi:phosphoribosylglycinamide formyltransferase-1